MKAFTEKQTAVIENERGRSHFTVASDAWCWLENGRLHWRSTSFGGEKVPGQVWSGDFKLPNGVAARDVRALVPDRGTVTAYTDRAAYRLDVNANSPDGRWSPGVALFGDAR